MVLEPPGSFSSRSSCPIGKRAEGLERLALFAQRAQAYARRRDFVDPPGGSAVSRLSPYLRPRILLEKEVVQAVWEANPSWDRVGKYIEEVLWRSYWKGWLELRPSVWMRYRREVAALVATHTKDARYESAIDGRTGIACYDAWVRELVETGYLHNHVRMWFASIWIFTLQLPWQLGAAFFMRHLLDGDPASNTLSWRWVAGLHTPGKHYVARAENIRKYTDGDWNPEGQLDEDPVPRLEAEVPDPLSLTALVPLADAMRPSLSASPCGLLVTEEDLSPDIKVFADCPFSSIAVFASEEASDDLGLSERVRRFRLTAVEDCAERLARHWDGDLTPVSSAEDLVFRALPEPRCHVSRPTRMRVYAGPVDAWTVAVCNWAVREHLSAVRMLQPPVGPLRERLPRLRVELRRTGVRLIEHRRQWDDLHWPHCEGGYFAFRRGLEDRLAATGLDFGGTTNKAIRYSVTGLH